MRALRNKNTRHNVKVHLSLSYICGGSHKSLWVLREGKRHGVVELSTSILLSASLRPFLLLRAKPSLFSFCVLVLQTRRRRELVSPGFDIATS